MLIVTKVEAVKEMMTLRPYDFGHPILDMLNWITSSNFGFFTRDGHKVSIISRFEVEVVLTIGSSSASTSDRHSPPVT
jgi:hypothetical protein